jgi:S1-C subfamily serine protease
MWEFLEKSRQGLTFALALAMPALLTEPAGARTPLAGARDVPGMVARVLPAVVSIATRQIERDQFNQPVPTRGLGSGTVTNG